MSESKTNTAQRRHGPMGGPGRGMMPGEKAKDFKGTLKKMIAFMGRFKAALVVVLVFAIGSTVFNIIGPKVLSTAPLSTPTAKPQDADSGATRGKAPTSKTSRCRCCCARQT